MPSGRSILGGIALLLALVAGVAAVSYAITSRQAKVYSTGAVIRFETEHPELQLIGLQIVIAPDDRAINTDTLVASSPPVIDATAQRLGVSPDYVSSNIAVQAVPMANAVTVQFLGPTARKAYDLATNYIQGLQSARRQIILRQSQRVVHEIRAQILILEGNHPNQAHPFTAPLHSEIAAQRALQHVDYGVPQVVRAPTLPTSPVAPRTQRNTLFGALFGALLAIALISVLFRSGRKRRNGLPPSPPTGGGPSTQSVDERPTAGVPAAGDDWHRRT